MIGNGIALSILSVLRDLFLNPLLYAGFALTFWDLRRTSSFERTFFGIRATRALRLTIYRGLQGLATGLVVSSLFVVFGVAVQLWEVAAVSVLALVFAGARLRFLSPIYPVAILATLSLVLRTLNLSWSGFPGIAVTHVRQFQVVDWLVVLAGILLAEAVLLLLRRPYENAPVVALSKRGKGIGALWTQLCFLLPVVVPTIGSRWQAPIYAHGSWHEIWISGLHSFSVLGLPVLVGFSGLFYALQPRQGIRQTAWLNVLSAVIALGAAALIVLTGMDFGYVALWLVVFIREVSLFVMGRRQINRDPLFAPSEEGVTVLTVLQGSLAETLGLKSGERITQVNGMPVHSSYDFHFALNQNPAYAKLAVVDDRGEVRFTGHTVYQGERSQLGLILAPDGQGNKALDRVRFGMLESLYAVSVPATGEPRVRASMPQNQAAQSQVSSAAPAGSSPQTEVGIGLEAGVGLMEAAASLEKKTENR